MELNLGYHGKSLPTWDAALSGRLCCFSISRFAFESLLDASHALNLPTNRASEWCHDLVVLQPRAECRFDVIRYRGSARCLFCPAFVTMRLARFSASIWSSIPALRNIRKAVVSPKHTPQWLHHCAEPKRRPALEVTSPLIELSRSMKTNASTAKYCYFVGWNTRSCGLTDQ